MKIYLVGGAVRDKLLGLPVKERDYVVVGANEEDMLKLGYQRVGKEFPVFLHPQTREEYALARAERKTGPGYKGFAFDASATVTLEEDLKRRDLTINAMAEEENGLIIDPYHGKADLAQKKLRHVSAAFAEDPVRILRVGRFLARYAYLGFSVDNETTELMRQMVTAGEVNALVAERVWKELERALGERNPEQFFAVMESCGALAILFPGIEFKSPGMAALQAACKLTTDTSIRLAALLYPSAENQLCNRYRVPNHTHELAKLTATFHIDAFNSASLPDDKMIALLSRLDIYRRGDRFTDFLVACEAIANTLPDVQFDANWLRECARAAKSYPVQELVEQGLQGEALAQQLKIKRQERIALWRKTH